MRFLASVHYSDKVYYLFLPKYSSKKCLKNKKLPSYVVIFSYHSKLSILWSKKRNRCKYNRILQIILRYFLCCYKMSQIYGCLLGFLRHKVIFEARTATRFGVMEWVQVDDDKVMWWKKMWRLYRTEKFPQAVPYNLTHFLPLHYFSICLNQLSH